MQVKSIKDSIANGIRICTFVLVYPRLIHSELLTHRVFSRNAASSRAIPTKAIIQNLRDDPAEIVWWGKNISGMQAKEELKGWQLKLAKFGWATARELAILAARFMGAIGLHKQIANRVLEPFQNIRVVVTSTEWNNYMALRNHADAQPEFQLLASMMYSAMGSSKPEVLQPGEWHIPYVTTVRMPDRIAYLQPEIAQTECVEITLEQALKISASMAAQESYRKSDPSLEKAEAIWERLMGSDVKHSSPTEHQAQAMQITNWVPSPKGLNGQGFVNMVSTPGITHMDRYGQYWSGNFRGFIQHRQLISNHDVKG
jgi:thymidylate synthase ThyX